MRDVFYIKDHGTCYLRNGVAPPYPCMMAWHTSGNDGYVRRARPAVIGIRGRPPSMAKPTSMDGGWELSGVPVPTNLCTLGRVEVAEKH